MCLSRCTHCAWVRTKWKHDIREAGTLFPESLVRWSCRRLLPWLSVESNISYGIKKPQNNNNNSGGSAAERASLSAAKHSDVSDDNNTDTAPTVHSQPLGIHRSEKPVYTWRHGSEWCGVCHIAGFSKCSICFAAHQRRVLIHTQTMAVHLPFYLN